MSYYEKIPSSINRLTITDASKDEAKQVYRDVSSLTGITVCEYFDYYFETTLKQLDNDIYKSNVSKCIEYIQRYDNNKTHKDVLFALIMSFQTIRMINKEIDTLIKRIEDRFNILKECDRQINKAHHDYEKLIYFHNNWEALSEQNPKNFFDIVKNMQGSEKYTLMYEKMDYVRSDMDIKDLSIEERIKIILTYCKEFIKGNKGDVHFALLQLKPVKDHVLVKSFWDKAVSKYEKLKNK